MYNYLNIFNFSYSRKLSKVLIRKIQGGGVSVLSTKKVNSSKMKVVIYGLVVLLFGKSNLAFEVTTSSITPPNGVTEGKFIS